MVRRVSCVVNSIRTTEIFFGQNLHHRALHEETRHLVSQVLSLPDRSSLDTDGKDTKHLQDDQTMENVSITNQTNIEICITVFFV